MHRLDFSPCVHITKRHLEPQRMTRLSAGRPCRDFRYESDYVTYPRGRDTVRGVAEGSRLTTRPHANCSREEHSSCACDNVFLKYCVTECAHTLSLRNRRHFRFQSDNSVLAIRLGFSCSENTRTVSCASGKAISRSAHRLHHTFVPMEGQRIA